MSLYHEAAEVLDIASRNGGSVKSIVFGRKDWKSDRKSLFVLSIEAAKWSNVLSDVVEKSGVLKAEKQVWRHACLLSKYLAEKKSYVNKYPSSRRSLPYYLLTTSFLRRRVLLCLPNMDLPSQSHDTKHVFQQS